jgi:hypothetical protein
LIHDNWINRGSFKAKNMQTLMWDYAKMRMTNLLIETA